MHRALIRSTIACSFTSPMPGSPVSAPLHPTSYSPMSRWKAGTVFEQWPAGMHPGRAERIGWRQRRQPNGTATRALRRGMGMALGIYKGGIGREAEAEVRITPAGRVEVHIGNVDVGQVPQRSWRRWLPRPWRCPCTSSTW